MMQLLCNGVRLDLYDSESLQFTHSNPLFAFDSLKCERTTQFKLPSTPKNDGVLSLARIPAYDGAGMRQKFTAQLQAGTIVKDGYLYVSKWNGSDYEAIFVTGELIGLQAIKDAGKLSEIMLYTEYVIVGQSPTYYANDATLDSLLFGYMQYIRDDGGTIDASINIGMLIDKICAYLGVSITTPSAAYKMRLLPPILSLPQKESGYMHSVRTEGTPYNTIYPNELQRLTIENVTRSTTNSVTYHNGYNNPYGEVLKTDTSTMSVAHFRTLNDIVITFPEDLPDDYVLVMMNSLVSGGATFLGDYSFTKTIVSVGEVSTSWTGEPLAGRSVELPANTSFILARESDYIVTAENGIVTIDDEPTAATIVSRGWQFTSGLNYNISVEIDPQNEEAGTDSIARLQDNLPDITLTQLLKCLATELGLILNYSESSGITFESVDLSLLGIHDVKNIIKKTELERRFADYAQRNIVRFTDDEVYVTERTQAEYTINNQNIEEEKELQVISWSNGGSKPSSYGVNVIDRHNREVFMELDASTGIFANRATISINDTIQSLCTASTQIIIQARMSMAEYSTITAKTLLCVDNNLYVWTERSWKDDVTSFTLAKIP